MIIICAVFYILYVWDFSLVLLIVMIAIPVMMYISLLVTKKSVTVDFALREHSAAKNEPFDVQLRISNKCIFPVGKAEALIEYYNVFNNQINSMELHFPIQAKNTECLTFQLSSRFCGILKIRSAKVTIYDPLRIFKFRTGKNLCEEITILPEGYEINGNINYSDINDSESSVYSEHIAGDDPSEVFGLREYTDGDKLNRIHWKLSSKKENLIVKEYSLPVDSPAAIFLDLHYTEFSEYTLPVYDTMIELLVSLSRFMTENGRFHSIIYFNAAENEFTERNVTDSESLAEIITELITSVRDDLHAEPPEMYFTENPSFSRSSFTLITAEYNEKLFRYIDEENCSVLKNLLLTVKNSENKYSENSFVSLNLIPVTAGRISSSVGYIEV